MANILISGDSWSCGEWGWENNDPTTGKYCNLHKGIEQYFKNDNHKVTNVGIGGISNIVSTKLLNKKIINNYDYILFFQTDPFRDTDKYNKIGKFHLTQGIKDYLTFSSDEFLEKQKDLLDKTYNKLNSFNKKIYCMGGASKLDMDLIKKYPNLIPLIPAITELLCPDYKHPEIWVSAWKNQISNIQNRDLVELIMKNFNKQMMLKKLNPKLFYPDGYHPNRYGHRIIYDYICRELHISNGK
jgi:hypothetical protein